MSQQRPLYVAGVGMITPVGANVDMTAAAVTAGISQFEASEYDNQERESITMSGVPEEVFEAMEVDIDRGTYYSDVYDRVIKMAIIAAREACAQQTITSDLPLVLALPEPVADITLISPQMLITNLANQPDLPIDAKLARCLHTGRAAGIQALDMAARMLDDLELDLVLVGASDSYWHLPLITRLDLDRRLQAPGILDGFVAGEGAGFLLLSRDPARAINREGHVVALWPPGLGEESGHMMSESPNLGEGLSQAFRTALNGSNGKAIRHLYSSLNGERFWAKEYGVALMRNQASFADELQVEHPADCYGDLGTATGTVLIGLCVQQLLRQDDVATNLVYSSSDGSARAALRVEKQSYNPGR